MVEDRVGCVLPHSRRERLIGFFLSFRSMKEFPLYFRGDRRMNVGAWWEVPGVVAQTLKISCREFSVAQGGPRPAATFCIYRQDGVMLLVDFGA